MFGENMHTHLTEMMGYAAAALVLATFSVRDIVTLRCLAIASNLMFIAYAASAALPPVLSGCGRGNVRMRPPRD